MDIENDNIPIIILNEDDEEVQMECETDELEPLEDQVVEFIDFDNPIQFTDEQIIKNMVNIISFEDTNVFKNRGFWSRRSNEFLKVLRSLSREHPLNMKLMPVIKAVKLVVTLEDYDSDAESDVEFNEELNESNSENTHKTTIRKTIQSLDSEKIRLVTQNNLLKTRYYDYMKRQEPYELVIPKAIKNERIWENDGNDLKHSVNKTLKNDTEGYIGLISPFKSGNRKHRFLGNLQDYKGDNVNICGYYYNVDATFKDTITIDFQQYIEELQKMVKGDKILAFDHSESKPIEGVVIENELDKDLIIEINADNIIVSKTVHNLHTNKYMIYRTNTSEQSLFHRNVLKKNNVLIIFPITTFDIVNILKIVIPSHYEVIMMHAKDYKNYNGFLSIEEFNVVFKKYGLDPTEIDEQTFVMIKSYLDHNSHTVHKSKPLTITKSHRKEFSSRYDLLKFHSSSYKYMAGYSLYQKAYKFNNKHNDDEYHRVKYLLSHGDDGLIFFSSIVNDYCEKMKSYVEKNEPHLKKDLEVIDNEIKKSRSVVQKECNDITEPDVKRTYKNIDELQADNFTTIPDVKEGDYAKLLPYMFSSDKHSMTDKGYILYKRIVVENGSQTMQQMWVRDRYVPYKSCSKDHQIPSSKTLVHQLCIYDSKDALCKNREYYINQNRIEKLKMKKICIEKLFEMSKNYSQIKIDLELSIDWIQKSSDSKYRYSPIPITYSNYKDYTNYVGDINTENEDHMQAEQGVQYTAFGAKKERDLVTDEIDFIFNEIREDTFDTNLVKNVTAYFLFKLSDKQIKELEKCHQNLVPSMIYPIDPSTQKQYKTIKEWIAGHAKTLKGKDTKSKDSKHAEALATNFVEKIVKRESVLQICALFIIFIQIQLPDIMLQGTQTKCDFALQGYPLNDVTASKNNGTLLSYISCIIHTNNVFEELGIETKKQMTLENIQKEITRYIQHILARCPIYKQALKATNDRLKIKKQTTQIDHLEWPGFRPILKIPKEPHENIVIKYIKRMYDVSSKTSVFSLKPNANILSIDADGDDTLEQLSNNVRKTDTKKPHTRIYGFFENDQREDMLGDEDLFNKKNITMSGVAVNNNTVPSQLHDMFDDDIEHAVHHMSLGKVDNDDYWEDFSSKVNDLLEKYLNFTKFNNETSKRLNRLLFHKTDQQQLDLRNVMRAVIKDDLKIFLGRFANMKATDVTEIRKLPQVKKTEQENVMNQLRKRNEAQQNIMKDIRYDIEFLSRFKECVSQLTRKLSYLDLPFSSMDDDETIKNSAYMYSYTFVYCLYYLLKCVHVQESDIFDLSDLKQLPDQNNVQLIFICQLSELMIDYFVLKVNDNIFDADDILRRNEKNREIRKETALKEYNQYGKEDHAALKQAKKLGLHDKKSNSIGGEETKAKNISEINRDDIVEAPRKKTDAQEAYNINYKGEDPDD